MQNGWMIILQLTFVTVVYCAAYRQGYRTAHTRIEAIMRELNKPIRDLFEKTTRNIDGLMAKEKDKPD